MAEKEEVQETNEVQEVNEKEVPRGSLTDIASVVTTNMTLVKAKTKFKDGVAYRRKKTREDHGSRTMVKVINTTMKVNRARNRMMKK